MADTINVQVTEESFAVEMQGASTWNGISGKPTFGSISSYNIWVGTEAEYTALGTYSDTTLYFTTA
jgi:hypothetical protein